MAVDLCQQSTFVNAIAVLATPTKLDLHFTRGKGRAETVVLVLDGLGPQVVHANGAAADQDLVRVVDPALLLEPLFCSRSGRAGEGDQQKK